MKFVPNEGRFKDFNHTWISAGFTGEEIEELIVKLPNGLETKDKRKIRRLNEKLRVCFEYLKRYVIVSIVVADNGEQISIEIGQDFQFYGINELLPLITKLGDPEIVLDVLIVNGPKFFFSWLTGSAWKTRASEQAR